MLENGGGLLWVGVWILCENGHGFDNTNMCICIRRFRLGRGMQSPREKKHDFPLVEQIHRSLVHRGGIPYRAGSIITYYK